MKNKCGVKTLLLLVFFSWFLPGCGGMDLKGIKSSWIDEGISDPIPSYGTIKEKIDVFREKLAKEKTPHLNADFITKGLLALAEKKLVTANENFQMALKFDPQNAHIHLLNGLAHQLRGDAGDPENYKLAEVAYDLTSRMDPGNSKVRYLGGILQFNQGNFQQAQEHFANAIVHDSTQPDYFLGLASAAYYVGDLGLAYANVEKALSLKPQDPKVLQASGIVYASLGEFDKAELSAKQLQGHKNRHNFLKERIFEWQNYYTTNKIKRHNDFDLDLTQKGSLKDTQLQLAQNLFGGSVDSAVRSLANKNGGGVSNKPIVDTAAARKGQIPQMALVDVAIIRSEEIFKASKGVNLLNGLNVFFNGTARTFIKPLGTNTLNAGSGFNDAITMQLGTLGAGLTYSMNIFSSAYDRNEVIARPTILVEHKKKSRFFSGGTMHIVLQGGVAGSGAMQPLPTGVTLDVTPNFLDANTIDLNVYAERTFLEAELSQVSDQLTGTSFAKTSKTSVAANLTLRYGETMVLTGLSDMENEVIDDKVPGIGDLPGIQYLFRKQAKLSAKKTVLILITPRRASLSDSSGNPLQEVFSGPKTNVHKLVQTADWMKPASNLKAYVNHLSKYEFFNHFRRGDMKLDNWAGEKSVESAIERALQYLYIYYSFDASNTSSKAREY